ncbi:MULTISPECIES: hypothetical protein [unclassified Streptomyces]|uniref:hypothetical protein n=1 Tax=Streptomyces TaxID=1883 RepID=UPI001367F23C|nr:MULTISPECIES: hypothetical protein [unclassified Streptomyces]NEA01319.1 hypothetical protein [Streptomyces sp. SID10116]MYY83946.1 hypothetical protein [Streptomyces sp. SID335]MYZ12124.1 hypothetical protein [Streptomyces sp. SID337]NDZ84148.1 hypothetical protein [Streptomyces sp. SID10115]NEB44643.1 hypothetical protein [Streptomyces sp. SID339]
MGAQCWSLCGLPVNSVLAVAARQSPVIDAQQKTAAREHTRDESDADHFGLLLASKVRPS